MFLFPDHCPRQVPPKAIAQLAGIALAEDEPVGLFAGFDRAGALGLPMAAAAILGARLAAEAGLIRCRDTIVI